MLLPHATINTSNKYHMTDSHYHQQYYMFTQQCRTDEYKHGSLSYRPTSSDGSYILEIKLELLLVWLKFVGQLVTLMVESEQSLEEGQQLRETYRAIEDS